MLLMKLVWRRSPRRCRRSCPEGAEADYQISNRDRSGAGWLIGQQLCANSVWC